MKNVSFKLPQELDEALTKLARTRKTSRSALVREALAAYTVAGRTSVTGSVDAITPGVDGPRDLSSNSRHLARYGK
ncbi:MAG TPA: CopG family transcriptional regulator [Gemmatimonadaceae bacterium]|nr:CopG family transcriptional regulator [Gemmatimonadaceae bacterium]